tara:strand:+ start:612 stop:1358 length:747 start_codon:yes stop_codon:yes gene_type:complete
MLDNITKVEEFHRYEFKYVINNDMAIILQDEIENFMNYDGYIHEELGNAYLVRSLYFDNVFASNFFEKIDGVRYRTKFRLRTYSKKNDNSSPLFLEQKGRHLNRVFKSRCLINTEDLGMFISENKYSELTNIYQNEVAEDFVFQGYKKKLKPRVLVDYIRKPYTSNYDSNFRITFDSSIKSQESSSLFPKDDFRIVQSLPGYVIMEVKFHRRIPAWFHRILQTHNLSRVSISKFVIGMTSCNLATDLS